MMLLNPYRFAVGGGGGSLVVWDIADFSPAGGWTFSGSGLVATESTSSNAFARTTPGKSSGKWYWEMEPFTSTSGMNCFVGVMDASSAVTSVTSGPYWLRSNGASSGFTSGVGGFTDNDNIGFALDVDSGKLWVRKNGGAWAGGGDPAAGTTPSATPPTGVTWKASVAADNDADSHVFTLKPTAGTAAYAAPAGFTFLGA